MYLIKNQRLKGECEGVMLCVLLDGDEQMCGPEVDELIDLLKQNGVKHVLLGLSVTNESDSNSERTVLICEQQSLTSTNSTDLQKAIREWGPGFTNVEVCPASYLAWQVALTEPR